MSDGWSWRNDWEGLLEEWKAWWGEMVGTTKRLSKPSLDPRNREHFVPHVLTNYIKETYDNLPRTLTYLTVVGLIVWICV